MASGPAYPPPDAASSPGGASSASAAASMRAVRRASPVRTSKTSRTVTRTRTGANDDPSGNATRTPPAPFARATRSAAALPSARYAALPRCSAPGRARSAKTGSNSRE